MIDIEVLRSAITQMFVGAVNYFPRLLTALLILLLGWVIGRVIATLVRRLAERVGLESILQRTGVSAGLEKAQIKQSGSELLARLIFWIIFLNFLLIGLESLGLQAAVIPLRELIAFLPRLLAAMVTLTAGMLLAQFLGKAAQATMEGVGIEFHEEVGQGVNLLLIVMVVVVVLEQLGIDATILITILTNTLTVVVAGLALAFGLGGREVARNVLAGYYIREQFQLGDRVMIDDEEGTLESIGTLNAEVQTKDGRLIVPNTRLTETAVKIKDDPAPLKTAD